MSLIERFQQWLSSRQNDTVMPIVLNRRRVYIVPTRTGLLFGVVLATMLVASINYILSLGYVLVFMLAGVGIVAMVHTWRNLAGLRVSPGSSRPVFAGECAWFPVQIENNHSLSRYALQMHFAQTAQVVRCNASKQGFFSVKIPYQTVKRGRLKPGRITVFTIYPLGLFYAWSYLNPEISCLVYPAPVYMPLPDVIIDSYSGEQYGQAGSDDFSGLRQWQSNDSPRHIAWKAVARDADNRPLLVKEFVGGATRELWLDWSQVADHLAVEDRLAILTGWVISAENQQLRYGLKLPGISIEVSQGENHLQRCLETLALYGLEDN